MLGLYISIPFDLENINEYKDEMVENYINTLINEMKLYSSYYDTNQSIYIGGLDPLSLPYNLLLKLLKETSYINNIEFTIECNINSLTKEKIELLKRFNVNRISLKIISFNNKILKSLNKNYQYKDISNKIKLLRKEGFNNINVDLNFNIINQSLNDLEYDLKKIKHLNINHVSYYEYENEESNSSIMYEKIINTLNSYNYEHYEISHFTNNKKYSMQNIIYWKLENYIGVGLNAHSFINDYIKINTNNLNDYLKEPLLEKKLTNKDDNIKLYLIYGLGQLRGINVLDFKNKYKFDILKTYPKLNIYIDEGFLSLNKNILKLTHKGLLYSSYIFEVFV